MPFLRAFAIVLIAGLGLLAAANYSLDGGDRWRGRHVVETQVGEIIAAGRHAETNRNYRSQVVHRIVIDRLDRTPDAVILGSSRIMGIRGRFLGDGLVLNHGVPSANLLDILAILSAYDRAGRMPRHVVIGVDPWIAKTQPPMGTRLRAFDDGRDTFGGRLGVDLRALGWAAEPPWELFSGRQLKSNLDELRQGDGPCGGVRARDDDDTPCAVRRPDGSLKWTTAFETIGPEALAAANALALSRRGRLHGFEGFDAPDDRYFEAFRRLLSHLDGQGSRVTILLSPYHPDVAAAPRVARDWALAMAVEERLRSIAADMAVPVVGSYSPDRIDCRPDEFMDFDHAKPSCLERIVAPIRSQGRLASG